MSRRTDCGRCGNPRDGSHGSYCRRCYAQWRKGRRPAQVVSDDIDRIAEAMHGVRAGTHPKVWTGRDTW